MNRKHNLIIIFTFLGTLFLFFTLSLFWPRRGLLKEENRMANPFPPLNWAALRKGEFSEGFERYYADQFPFRNGFMSIDKKFKAVLHADFAKKENDIQIFHAKQDLGLGQNMKELEAAKNKGPQNKASQSSETPTAVSSTPAVTSASGNEARTTGTTSPAASSSQGESGTASSSVPAPSSQKSEANLKLPHAGEDQVENVGSVIMVGNRAMEIYYHNEDGILAYVKRLNDLGNCLTHSTLYAVPAPTSIEFYGSVSLSSGANSQKASMDLIRNNLNDKVRYVDAYDSIAQAAQNSDNYLYLRTDHHWTQLGAYYAYRAFCKTAGFTPVELADMTHGTVEGDSYGSMLGATNRNQKLLDHPDRVEFWEPKHEVKGIAVDSESTNEDQGYENPLIARQVWDDNKYIAFTTGDHSYVHYTTDVKNGKSVLLIKESYGNAFAPFLVSHYEHVYILDPRRCGSLSLSQFCNEKNINDVIVLNYAFAFTNPTWQSAFESMIN